jgi:uncharacterized protein (TIGR01777 family)
MKVVITGGTGFLGSALASSLRIDGHQITVITRHPRAHDQAPWRDLSIVMENADAVVNFAGDPLDAGRWTAARKESILQSRVKTTEAVVNAMSTSSRRPSVLINASAIGYYGARGAGTVTEEAPAGSDFLASVCVAWEAAAMMAASMTRVVLLRNGVVLDRNDGALPKLALPFRLFAGGHGGSGRQYWSWIHRDDWVRLVRWTIGNVGIQGPLNLTAPGAVTNREFAHVLARVLRRPALLPAPASAVKLMLGEMADAMILNGQRVLPDKAQRGGFEFRYPELDAALRQIYR